MARKVYKGAFRMPSDMEDALRAMNEASSFNGFTRVVAEFNRGMTVSVHLFGPMEAEWIVEPNGGSWAQYAWE